MQKNKLFNQEVVKSAFILIHLDLHYQHLYKFAIQKVNDKEMAKDLVQETFLTAIEAQNKFEKRSSELTWLTAILKYKIYRLYRKNHGLCKAVDAEELEKLAAHLSVDTLNARDQLLDIIVTKQFINSLNMFLTTLPLKWQEVYQLKYVSDEKAPVICQELNISSENYWVISHRLKAALRKWYLKAWTRD